MLENSKILFEYNHVICQTAVCNKYKSQSATAQINILVYVKRTATDFVIKSINQHSNTYRKMYKY